MPRCHQRCFISPAGSAESGELPGEVLTTQSAWALRNGVLIVVIAIANARGRDADRWDYTCLVGARFTDFRSGTFVPIGRGPGLCAAGSGSVSRLMERSLRFDARSSAPLAGTFTFSDIGHLASYPI